MKDVVILTALALVVACSLWWVGNQTTTVLMIGNPGLCGPYYDGNDVAGDYGPCPSFAP